MPLLQPRVASQGICGKGEPLPARCAAETARLLYGAGLFAAEFIKMSISIRCWLVKGIETLQLVAQLRRLGDLLKTQGAAGSKGMQSQDQTALHTTGTASHVGNALPNTLQRLPQTSLFGAAKSRRLLLQAATPLGMSVFQWYPKDMNSLIDLSHRSYQIGIFADPAPPSLL